MWRVKSDFGRLLSSLLRFIFNPLTFIIYGVPKTFNFPQRCGSRQHRFMVLAHAEGERSITDAMSDDAFDDEAQICLAIKKKGWQ
ncbi:uncharacterized protein LOC131650228 isoform X4 [Vicia villosa]|uniref:uncharacterized protein LOC131650228 isoform X4 n=1 Tax=Vicia villosa TaxID=3911 RepID=UPI00273CCF71|nr:uncharacterized protein LOC131650228 isoform X4 [Vicia villosa]